MRMKFFSFFIMTVVATSCFDEKNKFDKTFFEKTTLINFPSKYKVLEAFDNGEFLTGAVLQMDSLTLRSFINDNRFDSVSSYVDTYILSSGHYLSENKPVFSAYDNVYYKRESKQKVNWAFIADLNSKRVWIEISYPDWGGD